MERGVLDGAEQRSKLGDDEIMTKKVTKSRYILKHACIKTKSSSSKLAVEADNTLNLAALRSSEELFSFLARLQWLVSARSVYLEVSMFQTYQNIFNNTNDT